MNSAYLQSEVLKSSERLLQAIAEEQKTRSAGAMNPGHARCQKRLGTARRAVELAAEHYVAALRSYRLATVAEFVPAAKTSGQPALPAKCHLPGQIKRTRGTVLVASWACRKRRVHSEESFAVSTRASKLQ